MILVTGGTGLVGAHLLYKLVKNNEKVRAIYRNEHKLKHVKQVFSTYSDDDDALFNHIDWIEANILDISQLNDAFTNVTRYTTVQLLYLLTLTNTKLYVKLILRAPRILLIFAFLTT